jgi:hypothetical protein
VPADDLGDRRVDQDVQPRGEGAVRAQLDLSASSARSNRSRALRNAAVAARVASASTGSTDSGSTGSGTGQLIIRLFTVFTPQEFTGRLSRQLRPREQAAQSP